MAKISVLMPVYNATSTLAEALQSLAAQTLVDYEGIAVDDGSTDGSAALLDAWVACHQRWRVLHLPHGGIIPALNAGLDICQAPLVARMDADDISHPQRLEKQAAYLQAHPETGVIGCLVAAFPQGQVREGFHLYMDWLNSLVTDAEIRREMFIEAPLAHPSVMFRRETIMRAGGYQERGWAEDYDLWLRLYLDGVGFAKVPEMLLEWRECPERLTRTDSRYSLENFLRAKAFYLVRGPLAERDAVIMWGAGMVGRRLSKHLLRQGCPLVAFIDIDPKKIGRTRRGLPILPPEALPEQWRQYHRPVLLAAVGARGARALIRQRLQAFGLREGEDWWGVA